MTPEEAEEIYFAGATAEYDKHKADYKPVNQRKTVLAGFQAVIDAVKREADTEYAMRYLKMNEPDAGDRAETEKGVNNG